MSHSNYISRFTLMLLFSCMAFLLLMLNMMNISCTYIVELNVFVLSSVNFSVLIILDKISLSFGFVVTLISSCVFAFAKNYMIEDLFYNRFIIILLSFVLSMNLLIFSGSILMILLGWDGLGITSFALIIYYQNKDSLAAGFLTMIVNRIGDVVIVSSMILMLMLGQFSIFPMSLNMNMLVIFLVVASLTKSAQYPFSPWLPAAMAAPTPVSALVHSSTLVTAGVYLSIRLSFNIPLSNESMSLLCFCGSMTCLLGGAAAICEMDLKKIIALSTLSQLGVMMFSLGMNFPFMALFHLYTHAMFKALLFLVAGMVLMMSFGTQDLRLLGGILMKSPILIVFQNISSLCLIGAPFMSAFYSKHAILELMIMSNINLFSVLVMILATICTAIYVFRSLKILCWGKIYINLNSNYEMSYFIPLLVLSLMGVMSGKMYLYLNSSVVAMMYLPFSWNMFINMSTIIGMSIGLLLVSAVKSNMLSSLLYLTPSLNKMVKPYSIVSKNMKFLDYGWLEPKFMLYPNFFKLINFIYNFLMWPSVNMYVWIRSVIILSIVFFMCYYM